VPDSGTLWKATRASAANGDLAWREIASRITAAVASELGLDRLDNCRADAVGLSR
jgi:hypothetical protein